MTAARPAVTVSLVTFNGARWLPGTLASLRGQTLGDYELLVIDNSSTDETRAILRDAARADHRVRVTNLSSNVGFASAHNRNISEASAEIVCLLNQDIELDERFLSEAAAELRQRPDVGAIQARVRRLDASGGRTDFLDSTGLVMQRDRRVVSRGQGDPDSSALDLPGPVFGADGPVPVYRRSALIDAKIPSSSGGWEYLDEDFFMYKEDVDLAWRLQLLGWSAWYAPKAIAWHARGAGGPRARSMVEIARTNNSIPRWIKAMSWRNQRLMQVKNELPSMYLRDLPWIARREILSMAFIVIADPRRLTAVPALLRAVPSALRKRRAIQARRNVRGSDIRRWFLGSEPS